MGIGELKEEVLDRIAEAVYLSKDGISQILFITGGRFDQFEMSIYSLLKTIIFDESVTKFTTIVRTRFPDFENKKSCQKDIEKMLSEKELGNILFPIYILYLKLIISLLVFFISSISR